MNNNPADKPLKGYKKVTPMVYCGLYPIDGSEYENLKVALEKLQLNDAALEYEPETSAALGSVEDRGFYDACERFSRGRTGGDAAEELSSRDGDDGTGVCDRDDIGSGYR